MFANRGKCVCPPLPRLLGQFADGGGELLTCPICFNSCAAEYHVDNGRVITITGFAADPVTRGRMCPKGHYEGERRSFHKRTGLPYVGGAHQETLL